ncbi:SDR family oxidoreductase [bacterium]|nr:SDR family oxidoreductase [bacterium]
MKKCGGGTWAFDRVIKTAVIGADGYLGRRLWNMYRKEYPDCVGTVFSNPRGGLVKFDLHHPDICPLRLEETGHRAVFICAAKSGVTDCEDGPEASYSVNVTGTLDVIRQVGRTSMQVIFPSSDYVFDGRGGRYDDGHPTAPETEYGRQKAAVERALPSLSKNFLVLRLSKIFGTTRGDGTLLDEMAAGLAAGLNITAAPDQYFCPLHVDDFLKAADAVQVRQLTGVMNVAGRERLSRYDLAIRLAGKMNVDSARVRPVRLHDIPSMKGRPRDTSMVCSRLTSEAGFSEITPLSESIRKVAENWKEGPPIQKR